MCESWIYGCGHAIRTPCPRPKPARPSTNTSIAGSTGSNIPTTTSTHSSPRRNSSNASASTDLSIPISKFCNGFPRIPKETSAPCYNCILADARAKIALEKAEVDAKKDEILRSSMSRTVARGPEGRYVDEFGNSILAEEEYEMEFGNRRPVRERGFTSASAGCANGTGNARFSGNGYARGDFAQDRRHSTAGAGPNGSSFPYRRSRDTSNGFEHLHHRESDNKHSGRQDTFQDGQRGGDTSMPNSFAPRRNTYTVQNGGYYQHQPQQQHTDFGGASWGQNMPAGGLGNGLDRSMYQQQQQQYHQHQY